MKNNLSDLNNHLFAQLELLGSGELNDKELDKEIKKAKAMTSISSQILKVASLQISAIRTAESCGLINNELPALIETKDSKIAEDERKKREQKMLGAATK